MDGTSVSTWLEECGIWMLFQEPCTWGRNYILVGIPVHHYVFTMTNNHTLSLPRFHKPPKTKVIFTKKEKFLANHRTTTQTFLESSCSQKSLNGLYSIVLCCIALYCIVLYCTGLKKKMYRNISTKLLLGRLDPKCPVVIEMDMRKWFFQSLQKKVAANLTKHDLFWIETLM